MPRSQSLQDRVDGVRRSWTEEEERSFERVRRIQKEIEEDSSITPKSKEDFLDEVDDFCPITGENDVHANIDQALPSSITTTTRNSRREAQPSTSDPDHYPVSVAQSTINHAYQAAAYYGAPPSISSMTPQYGTYGTLTGHYPGAYLPDAVFATYPSPPTQTLSAQAQHSHHRQTSTLDPQAVPYSPNPRPPFVPPAVPVLPQLPDNAAAQQPQQPNLADSYVCQVCYKVLETDRARVAHVHSRHARTLQRNATRKGRVPCLKCGKVLESEQGWVAHVRAEHRLEATEDN